MWNYAEIDKYITVEHLQLILPLLQRDKHLMIRAIDRVGDEYTFRLTDAGRGYARKFRIENGAVIDLGRESVWMS